MWHCKFYSYYVVYGAQIERRLSVTNLSSENNFADVSTECSSRHQLSKKKMELRLFHSIIPPFSVSSNIKTVHALMHEYLVGV